MDFRIVDTFTDSLACLTGDERKADGWQARIARQQQIDKSIAAKAEFDPIY